MSLAIDGRFVPGPTRPRTTAPARTSTPAASRASAPATSRATPPRVAPSPARSAAPMAVPSRPTGSGAVASVTQPAPRPPSLKSFLAGDDVYQQAQRGGQRTLNDLLSELTRQRTTGRADYRQTRQTMEQDRERQLASLHDEFSSRGLLHSGIYAQEQGRFQEDFSQQMTQLERGFQQMLQDLLGQERNFRREQDLAMEIARQEAVARRAAQYNIR